MTRKAEEHAGNLVDFSRWSSVIWVEWTKDYIVSIDFRLYVYATSCEYSFDLLGSIGIIM